MTSTFSPNINLQLQGLGDNSNSWGGILNSAVFGNIDQALGSGFTVSVAGSSDYTLSQANALDIFHNPTGILTGNINYIFPASAGRIVIIKNSTTGSFSLTVKQLGGTGIVIPQGCVALVYLNPLTTTASIVVPVTTYQNIASATTTDIGSTQSQNVQITGTTTITGLGSSATLANPLYFVTFSGALTLFYNATSLNLPGASNITTAANDSAIFLYLGSGNWQCLFYQYSAFSNYSQGTFTPVLSFGGASVGITYSTQTGKYTRIGNIINFTTQINLSSKGSSTGVASIGGLPIANGSNQVTTSLFTTNLAVGATTSLQAIIGPSTTNITPYKYAAGATTQLVDTDFGSSTVIIISGMYLV